MSWPTKIQLHDSSYSHSYDGSQVVETFYVEPYDALTAFVAAMLGRVDPTPGQPSVPSRTPPAVHFLYKYCPAVRCDTVPYDPESFSYMGSAVLSQPIDNAAVLTTNLLRITDATSNYGGPLAGLGPRAGIDEQIMSQANSTYSAGCFVAVTYQPILSPFNSSGLTLSGANNALDAVNWRFNPQVRTNVINAGLRLITPGAVLWYPSAGVAPVLKEEYLEFVAERRMLLPTFNLSDLATYVNAVNGVNESLGGQVPLTNMTIDFVAETLRFSSFEPEFVQVPTVDADGEPDGFNRWLNLTLHWDWRLILSQAVHDSDTGLNDGEPNYVTWNHILAWPGNLAWLQNLLANVLAGNHGAGLGWFYAKFASGGAALFADTPAYPFVTNITGDPGAKILDPLTRNF